MIKNGWTETIENTESLLDAMRSNIEIKERFIDKIITENVELKERIKKLKEMEWSLPPQPAIFTRE